MEWTEHNGLFFHNSIDEDPPAKIVEAAKRWDRFVAEMKTLGVKVCCGGDPISCVTPSFAFDVEALPSI